MEAHKDRKKKYPLIWASVLYCCKSGPWTYSKPTISHYSLSTKAFFLRETEDKFVAV